MGVPYLDNTMLPWSEDKQESRRFWVVLLVIFVLSLPLAFVIPLITLPEKERSELEALPPQLAKVILEKKKIVKKEEPKKPEPEKEKEKEKEKPKEKPPEVKKKPKPVVKKSPPKQTVKEARKVAESSGLLALQDDLSDMREALSTTSLTSTPNMIAKTMAAKANAIDSKKVFSGSGGVNSADMAVPAETVALSSRDNAVLSENELEKATEVAKKRSKGNERSVDNIRRVFDQNKSSLFTLYNRELRKNPSLKGKVVLSITIEPDGTVSACKVVSSDLNSPKLERKLASRVRLFNFGAKPVKAKTVSYPIVFFQS